MRAPHTQPAAVRFPDSLSNSADPRLRHRIQPWGGEAMDAVLLGVPFDFGVALDGGRAGAAGGPNALRKALWHFGTTYDLAHDVDFDQLRVGDAGDLIVVSDDVEATHDRLTEATKAILDAGAIPLVIGGGNDLSFATVRALVDHTPDVAVVNVDAHFDVQSVEEKGLSSTTPYRRVLERLPITGSHLVQFGAHAAVNSRAHLDWLRDRGARVVPLNEARNAGVAQCFARELDRLAARSTGIFVSIDLDVFAASYAPGVSSPGTEGLIAEEGRSLAFTAGRRSGVQIFELMELNPKHDINERTARLAALLICAFLSGLAVRQAEA